MSERRTVGVPKRLRRQKTIPGSNRLFTYYGREDCCAICDVAVDDLSPEAMGEWTFHWDGAGGMVIVAETCSAAHAMEFDVFHGSEVAEEWAETVEIRRGRQIAQRKAGRRR